MRVSHTFAGFERVGNHGSIGGDLPETSRFDNSFPLIPKAGMSGAPGDLEVRDWNSKYIMYFRGRQ